MGYMGPEEFHELFFLAQLVAFFCGKNHDSPTEYLQLIGTKLVVLFDIFGGWRMVKHDETMVNCNWILWTQWDFKINNGDWSTTTDLSIKHWVGSFQQRWGFKNQRMIELVSGGQWRGYNWPIGEQKIWPWWSNQTHYCLVEDIASGDMWRWNTQPSRKQSNKHATRTASCDQPSWTIQWISKFLVDCWHCLKVNSELEQFFLSEGIGLKNTTWLNLFIQWVQDQGQMWRYTRGPAHAAVIMATIPFCSQLVQ